MGEVFKLFGTIGVDNSEANKALDDVENKGKGTANKLTGFFSKLSGKIGQSLSGIGKKIDVSGIHNTFNDLGGKINNSLINGFKTGAKWIAVGGTALMAGAGATLIKGMNLAGELEQNMGGSVAVFGKYANQMQQTGSQAFQTMGLSQSDFLANANKMGSLFQGAGFSVKDSMMMTSDAMLRASDVASIMGVDIESAMEAVGGMAKGNFTMMDNLGVAMNDTTIGNYALAKGIEKSTTEMTTQEKIGLATQMFMEKTAKYAGNYAKENDTLAGSLQTAKSALSNFMSGASTIDEALAAGMNFAEVAGRTASELAPKLFVGILEAIKTLIPQIPSMIDGLAKGMANVLGEVFGEDVKTKFENLVGIISGVFDKLKSAFDFVVEYKDMFTPIAVGIATVMGLLSAYNTVMTISKGIQTAYNAVMGIGKGIQAAWAVMTGTATAKQIALNAAMSVNPIAIIIIAIVALVAALVYFFTKTETGIAIWKKFTAFLTNAWETVKTKAVEIWTAISDFMVNLWDGIVSKVSSIAESFSEMLSNVWTSIKEGATSIFEAIASFFTSVWDKIKQIFSTTVEFIKNVLTVGFLLIQSIIQGAMLIIQTAIQFYWNIIKAVIDTVMNAIKAVIELVWSVIGETITNALNFIKNIITNVWNAIVNTMTNILNIIKNVVSTAWNFIKTVTSTIFEAVKAVVLVVWGAIKTFIQNFVNGIKIIVTTAWNVIKTVTTTVFNAVKAVVLSVWDSIKSTITNVVNGVKSVVTSVWNAIKSVTSSVFNAIKSVATSVWNGIKSAIQNVVNGIKTAVSNVWNSIKSTTSSVFNGIKSTASSVWNGIKSAMIAPVEAAKSKIKGIIDAIKGFFSNISLKLPKISMPALPHFKLSGSFSLKPPSVPKLGVEWYADGGIMEKAMAFGMNGNNVMVGGEAGREAILPLNRENLAGIGYGIASTMDYSQELVIAKLDELVDRLEAMFNRFSDMKIVMDSGELVGAIKKEIDKQLGRSSGNKGRGRAE